MKNDEEIATPNGSDAAEGEMSEAEIDQNLADTFPASDPPSWTLGTDHASASRSESHNDPSSKSSDSEPKENSPEQSQ